MSEPVLSKTPLYDEHLAGGGKLVDFAGYALPVHYGSTIEEHHAVRRSAGVFDVSHMTIVDVDGDGSEAWLRKLIVGDVANLVRGQALYGCLCNASGGVIDDLIAYRLGDSQFRIIVNAATREKDLAWFEEQRHSEISVSERSEFALLAIQGPDAVALAAPIIARSGGIEHSAIASLQRFHSITTGQWFVARTGYTGEDGLEVALPSEDAAACWRALIEAGVHPAGLGARDTLRLEAGLSLYGNELDEQHSPYESGIGWTVDFKDPERDFIGREALWAQKQHGAGQRLIGLVLEGRGVLRAGQPIQVDGNDAGHILSGTFSPTRKESIATARVLEEFKDLERVTVQIRDKGHEARRVKLPFVRNGRAT